MPQAETGPVDDEPDTYLGLSVDEARDQAGARGWSRVREVTGEHPVVTLEYLPDRINFHVDAGRVVRCWLH